MARWSRHGGGAAGLRGEAACRVGGGQEEGKVEEELAICRRRPEEDQIISRTMQGKRKEAVAADDCG